MLMNEKILELGVYKTIPSFNLTDYFVDHSWYFPLKFCYNKLSNSGACQRILSVCLTEYFFGNFYSIENYIHR